MFSKGFLAKAINSQDCVVKSYVNIFVFIAFTFIRVQIKIYMSFLKENICIEEGIFRVFAFSLSKIDMLVRVELLFSKFISCLFRC